MNDNGPVGENQQSTCPTCGKAIPGGRAGVICPSCALAVTTEAIGRPGKAPEEFQSEHFEVLDLIGSGGMGTVYRARHRSLDREIAIKLLAEELGGHPGMEQRFLREAQAMARLDHPNIVTVHDFAEEGGRFYLVMELVEGRDLKQIIDAGDMNSELAMKIVPQICAAVQFAHDRGIIHRDIKPSNILVDADGQVKVADFGLAKLRGDGDPALTMTGAGMGTLQYMAPEQRGDAGKVDHRADIYALGVMIYEMLTGKPPGPGSPPPSERAGTDPRLDQIVLRAMDDDPGGRHDSAAALNEDLSAVAVGKTAAGGASTGRVKWFAVALGLVGLAALVLLATGRWRADRQGSPHAATQEEVPVASGNALVLADFGPQLFRGYGGHGDTGERGIHRRGDDHIGVFLKPAKSYRVHDRNSSETLDLSDRGDWYLEVTARIGEHHNEDADMFRIDLLNATFDDAGEQDGSGAGWEFFAEDFRGETFQRVRSRTPLRRPQHGVYRPDYELDLTAVTQIELAQGHRLPGETRRDPVLHLEIDRIRLVPPESQAPPPLKPEFEGGEVVLLDFSDADLHKPLRIGEFREPAGGVVEPAGGAGLRIGAAIHEDGAASGNYSKHRGAGLDFYGEHPWNLLHFGSFHLALELTVGEGNERGHVIIGVLDHEQNWKVFEMPIPSDALGAHSRSTSVLPLGHGPAIDLTQIGRFELRMHLGSEPGKRLDVTLHRLLLVPPPAP